MLCCSAEILDFLISGVSARLLLYWHFGDSPWVEVENQRNGGHSWQFTKIFEQLFTE